MPGANTRALEKARTLDADALILDLEDAVAPTAKPEARQFVCDAVKSRGYGTREVVIRVNAPDTPWWEDDLSAAVAASPDAVLVPKVSSASDVTEIEQAITRLSASTGRQPPQLWIMIETPRAILNIAEIAETATREGSLLTCLVLGTNDLAKETGASLDAERIGMLAWLSMTVAAARTNGLAVVDGVYNNFRDIEGFRAECQQGVHLGMDGKTLIHPAQLELANALFAPSAEEVERARKIIAAFASPENADLGVITVDGKMVERLHAEIAADTVAVADAIAARALSTAETPEASTTPPVAAQAPAAAE